MAHDVAQRPVGTVLGGRADAGPAPVPRRIRVALLDDLEADLTRAAGWLAAHAADLEVVLTARTWASLVHSPAFPADVVVLALQPAATLSLEARIRTCRASGAAVVVRVPADDTAGADRALAAGAVAVLDATRPPADLAAAARSSAPRDWRPLPQAVERPRLSLGETEALRLYASGHSTNEVAAAMNVQFETAKTYLRRVRGKYARVNRPASKKSELTRRAREDGYLS